MKGTSTSQGVGGSTVTCAWRWQGLRHRVVGGPKTKPGVCRSRLRPAGVGRPLHRRALADTRAIGVVRIRLPGACPAFGTGPASAFADRGARRTGVCRTCRRWRTRLAQGVGDSRPYRRCEREPLRVLCLEESTGVGEHALAVGVGWGPIRSPRRLALGARQSCDGVGSFGPRSSKAVWRWKEEPELSAARRCGASQDHQGVRGTIVLPWALWAARAGEALAAADLLAFDAPAGFGVGRCSGLVDTCREAFSETRTAMAA